MLLFYNFFCSCQSLDLTGHVTFDHADYIILFDEFGLFNIVLEEIRRYFLTKLGHSDTKLLIIYSLHRCHSSVEFSILIGPSASIRFL